MSQQDFRQALGQFATGITIITALDSGSAPIGLTANSFASVSLDPPLILWSMDKASPVFSGFAAASHYAVHVLDDRQQSLSEQFSNDDIDKFADLNTRTGINGLPLLDQYIALFQCAVIDRHDTGDHLILIGEVLDIQHDPGNPLLFFSGEYRRLQT